MGQTYADLLAQFWNVSRADYRSEPERMEAMLSIMADTMQTMLEKLRDLDPN